MKKKIIVWLGTLILAMIAAVGCGRTDVQEENGAGETAVEEAAAEVREAALEDGIYTVSFDTDSSMFHVNETCDGKARLTVKDGSMILHITLTSKNILNLFPGTAEEAQLEGAKWLSPTVDEVTYSDGTKEEVHGFDVPVPVLEEEFDLALIGKKGKWYDHKVCVSNPEKAE